MKNLQILAEIKESAKTLFSAIITLISPLITAVATLIKYSWKLTRLVIIVGVVALIVAMCVSRSTYHKISSRYYVYKYDVVDRYRVKDMWQNKWTTGYIASVDREFGCDSLVRISKKNIFGNNERYGYLDVRTGAVAIDPQFQYAGEFSEGLAPIRNLGEVGFIDTTGKLAVSVKGTIRNLSSAKMSNGCAIVDIGGNNTYGILSHNGEWLLEPIYNHIEKCYEDCYIVKNKWCEYGVWSQERGWLFELEYDFIEEGMADLSFVVTKDGAHREIYCNGKVVIPFVYDSSDILSYQVAGRPEEEYITSEYAVFYVDKMAGLFEVSSGKVLIPAKYDGIDMLSKGVFEVDNGGYKFLVDKNGNAIGEK